MSQCIFPGLAWLFHFLQQYCSHSAHRISGHPNFRLAWAWAGTLTFTLAVAQAVTLFEISAIYDALACAGLAAVYMFAERALFFTSQKLTNQTSRFWSGMFHLPLTIFALLLAALGLHPDFARNTQCLPWNSTAKIIYR